MYPPNYEIEEVGNAFIAIAHHDYTDAQMQFLDQFLREYARDLDETQMKKIFKDKIDIADAIKVLYDFANHYQDEKDIFNEFKEEMDELVVILNASESGIAV